MYNGKIFTCYHKECELINNEIVKPIQVNKYKNEYRFLDITDDSGENISYKNPIYCEMTALYWMWKNCHKESYLGLFHYRRLLMLNTKFNKRNEITIMKFDDRFLDFGLNEDNIEEMMGTYDLILPKPVEFKVNLYEQYRNGYMHRIEHLDLALNFIARNYKEYIPYINKFKNSYSGFFCNLFIMKKEILDKYCEWLFPILEYVENEVDYKNYSFHEKRFIGFISERLFTIYLFKLLDEKRYSCYYATRIFIEEFNRKPKVEKIINENSPILIFGTGKFTKSIVPKLENEIIAFIDNDRIKHEKLFLEKKVYSVQTMMDTFSNKYPIFVCSSFYQEIKKQLEELGLNEDVDFFELTERYFD